MGLRNTRGVATYDIAVTRDGEGRRGSPCFERRQKLGAGPRRVPCRRLTADLSDNDLAVRADRLRLSDIAVAAEQSRSACSGPVDGAARGRGANPATLPRVSTPRAVGLGEGGFGGSRRLTSAERNAGDRCA